MRRYDGRVAPARGRTRRAELASGHRDSIGRSAVPLASTRPPDRRQGPAGKSESSCSSRSCRAARSRVLRTRRAGARLGVNRRGTRNRGVEERTFSVTQRVRKCPTASRASSRSVVKRVTVDIAASPTVARQPSFRRREMLVGPGIIRVRACRHERTGGRRWPRRAGARRTHDAAAAVYDQPIGIRLLFGDPNSGKEHYLIRYAPGVRGRAHRHTGTPWSSSRGRLDLGDWVVGPGRTSTAPGRRECAIRPPLPVRTYSCSSPTGRF
jgi:hypothetical protein